MNKSKKVPDSTLLRLSYYLRAISYFLEEQREVISSKELAKFLRISHHQLRKDLSYFGQFGRKGVGYSLELLKERLREILGLDRSWFACIVGFGNLAKALSFYKGFRDQGIFIKAGFDVDKKKINKDYGFLKVYPLGKIEEIIKKEKINIGIVTVPKEKAQAVATRLSNCGVRAILNFTPLKLEVGPNIIIKDVDLSCQLACLTYYLKSLKE